MNLKIDVRGEDAIFASYTCPCGCNPGVSLRRDTELATEGCCCGNEFAVGHRASGHIIEQRYVARPGFALQVQPFLAPWGETIEAAWAVGASKHPEAGGHEHGHGDADHGHAAEAHDGGHGQDAGHGQEHGHAREHGGGLPPDRAIDPVCGMTVDIETAKAKGLSYHYAGTDYYFCGRGCRLDFEEDPGRFLDPKYIPSM